MSLCVWHFPHTISSNPHTSVMSYDYPSFRGKRLRHRGMNGLVQGHGPLPAKNAHCPGIEETRRAAHKAARAELRVSRLQVWNSGKPSHLPERKKMRGKSRDHRKCPLRDPYTNNAAGIHCLELHREIRCQNGRAKWSLSLASGEDSMAPFCSAAILLPRVCFSLLTS